MITSKPRIRNAKIEEADFLSKIALSSKAYWGYDEEFLEKCKPYLTISQNDIIQTLVYVIENKNSILGFYQLKPLNKIEIDLAMFFIDPNHIKKNLGEKMLKHSKDISKELGYKSLIIESDPNAKGFYEKQGGKFRGYSKSEVFDNRILPVYEITL
ncbi:MAG: GNAT family N-acetyltransferase [Candidatus Hodarchaeales archaeon]|jgi:N-acetylglutamate synthase-like GNAT family acetyltransferase